MMTAKKIVISFIFILSLFSWSIIAAPRVLASGNQALVDSQIGLSEIGEVYGGSDDVKDIRVIALNIINIALTFVGLILFLIILSAGFKYMTSQGNKDVNQKALATIRNAAIGLLIILSSIVIVKYSLAALSWSVNGSGSFFYYLPNSVR